MSPVTADGGLVFGGDVNASGRSTRRPATCSGSSGSSSADDAANSDSAPPRSSRSPRPASRPLPTAGWPAPAEKRRAEGVPTFAEAAERVLEQKRGGWRGR